MSRLVATLSMQITYQCNIECKHCGPYCGPHEKDWMTVDEIKDLIFQAGELGAYNVVFTGGEPTLLGDKNLIEILRFIHEKTPITSTRLVTNGKWATTYEKAYEKLKLLKEAGLQELNVSSGEFHTEFVPIDRVVNAYRAGRDLNYPTVLTGGVFLKDGAGKYTSDFFKKAIKQAIGEEPLDLNLKSPYVSECHGLLSGSAMDYGRGKQYIKREDMEVYDEQHIPSLCKDVLGVITVQPNGNTNACCGVMTRDESFLTLGNWRDEKLKPMLERANKDIILNWIRHLGLKDMKSWLLQKDSSLTFTQKYASICDLCAQILYNKQCQELLIKYGHEKTDDILVNKISHDATIYSECFNY